MGGGVGWTGVEVHDTLRASLPGTFLQTQSGYATLYLLSAVHRRVQRPPKGLSTNMTMEAA